MIPTKQRFIDGATSNYVEKEKIKFAIEILADLHDEMDYPYTDMITLRIEELEQQLSEL